MEQRIGERQRWVWMSCGLSAAAVIVTGFNWLWVLLGGILLGVYHLYLDKRLGADGLAKRLAKDFGFAGRLILVVTVLWLVLVMGYCACLADAAFPMSDGFPALGWVLLALAAWGSRKGSNACAGCSGILSLLLLILYSIIAVFSLPEVEVSYLMPDARWGESVKTAGLLLLSAGVWYLPVRQHRGSGRLLAWIGVPVSVLCAVTAGVLSPEAARAEQVPLYELARSVSVLGVVERIEPLLSAAMTLGIFCLISSLACACQELAGQILPQRWYGSLCCLAAAGTMFLANILPQRLLVAGNLTFFCLLPIGVTLVQKKS